MHRPLLIALAASLAIARGAGAQQSPAPPDVRMDRVRLGTDTMQVYLEHGGEQVHAGVQWDEIRVIDVGGSPAVQRVYRQASEMLGERVDTIVSSVPGLRPRSFVTHGPMPLAIVFRADSIVGWRTGEEGARVPVAHAVRSPVYDGSSFDLIVRAGALAEGYRISIPAYLSTGDSIVMLSAEVTGSERVEVEDGRFVDTWEVEMDFAGLSTTLWIDKRTRSLARQVIRLDDEMSLLLSRVAPANRGGPGRSSR